MQIEKNRIFTYFFSSILLAIFILNCPISQPLKYILFIFINFFFIILPIKKHNYLNLKNFFTLLGFFLFIFIINLIPLKFSFQISNFNDIQLNKLSEEANKFYRENFKFCYENNEKCFGKKNFNLETQDIFFRNYLNISNLNELRSNVFHSPESAMTHQSEYIDKFNYPFLLDLKFPKLYYESEICFSKNLDFKNCHLISKNKKNFEIFDQGEKYNIKLIQNLKIISLKIILSIILFSLFVIIINKLYHFKIIDKFELLYPISLVTILIIISLTNIENINFLNSYFYQYPGGDGHLYLIFSNLIAQSIKNFNIYDALKGGNNIFYYMPGMRYFVAIEKIIYGNAYYLHLIILSFLPFILRKLLSFYLSNKIVIILMISFLFFPLMHHMGFSYFQFFRYFTKVFAEPIAYTIFLFAFLRLIYWFKNTNEFYKTLPITCLLFSFSCILRPNLSSSSFFFTNYPSFLSYKK